MSSFWEQQCPGPVPPNAKQTNCWRLYVILIVIQQIYEAILYLGLGQYVNAVFSICWMFLMIWILQHVAYVEIVSSEQIVEIRMGPKKCSFCAWFFSNRLYKKEIILIESKQRQCCFDIIPRLYCTPVMWCCCHKSYNAYWWPFCCDGINCCTLCDGDSPSNNYIQFNLTDSPCDFGTVCCKHCSPCPLQIAWIWCYVFNRIAVSVKVEEKDNVLRQLQSLGYPLQVAVAGGTAPVAATTTTTTTTTTGQLGQTNTTAVNTTTTVAAAPAQTVVVQPGQQVMMVNGQPMVVVPVQGQVVQQQQQPQVTPGQVPAGSMYPVISAPPNNASAPPAYNPNAEGV